MIHDGAFVEFSYSHYLPGIRWNQSTVYSTKEIHPIPCVLGASYAASKRYWNKISGLEGLMHYGCEEAFLSTKAWMEGGGCALLYNVIFGHIYRTDPPYRVVSSSMYYNSFVISNTLFPSSLRCMADSIGHQMSPSVFREICFWLSINSDNIKELRHYFINNFNCDIDRIIKLNAVETCEKEQSAMIERNRLESIVKYVTAQAPIHLGLYDGLMGQVLSLGIYLNYNPSDAEVESQICAQFTQLCERLLTDITTPYNFADGLCGIGWGLIYLMRHRYTNERFEIELNFIDRKIQELAPERISDMSLETGVCGIMCYVVNREDTKQNAFGTDFLDELSKVAKKIISAKTDFRSRYYALRVLALSREQTQNHAPLMKDIIDLPTFLPKDMKWWQPSMKGCYGFLVNLSITLSNLERYKNWQLE